MSNTYTERTFVPLQVHTEGLIPNEMALGFGTFGRRQELAEVTRAGSLVGLTHLSTKAKRLRISHSHSKTQKEKGWLPANSSGPSDPNILNSDLDFPASTSMRNNHHVSHSD